MKNPRLYRKGQPRPIGYLQDVYARLRMRADRKFWSCLKPVRKKSISTGCDFYELWTLYRHVRKAKPNYILELGCGVSTVVIAYAIHSLRSEGYSCTFVSMEESETYHAQLASIIPSELKPLVDLVLSPVEDRQLGNGLIARCYAQKPQHAYDFVFIDGPQIPQEDHYFDGDLIDVLAWNEKPFVAFLDERLSTRKILKRLLPFARCSESRGFAKFFLPEAAKGRVKYGYASCEIVDVRTAA